MTGLIGELSGYVWDAKAAKQGEERPVKLDDHGPDALRDGVMRQLSGGAVPSPTTRPVIVRDITALLRPAAPL